MQEHAQVPLHLFSLKKAGGLEKPPAFFVFN
jgi:hypothetical protein